MTQFVGRPFISSRGVEELNDLRIGSSLIATDGEAPIQMLARVPSDECGCPEELWAIDNLSLLFHFEEDGTCDMFIFAGDWELESHTTARSLNELRAKAFQWFAEVMAQTEEE